MSPSRTTPAPRTSARPHLRPSPTQQRTNHSCTATRCVRFESQFHFMSPVQSTRTFTTRQCEERNKCRFLSSFAFVIFISAYPKATTTHQESPAFRSTPDWTFPATCTVTDAASNGTIKLTKVKGQGSVNGSHMTQMQDPGTKRWNLTMTTSKDTRISH